MFNSKRVCIFVDGENMRHAIVELFPTPIFNEFDYLPKNADWTKFFDWITMESAGEDSERSGLLREGLRPERRAGVPHVEQVIYERRLHAAL